MWAYNDLICPYLGVFNPIANISFIIDRVLPPRYLESMGVTIQALTEVSLPGPAADGRPSPTSPCPEVWPFSEQGRENFQNLPPARPKEQKENIFRCGGFAAQRKIILSPLQKLIAENAESAEIFFIEFCFFKATPGVVLGGTWALTPPPDPLPSPAQRERGGGIGGILRRAARPPAAKSPLHPPSPE